MTPADGGAAELLPCPFCNAQVTMRPPQCLGEAWYILHVPQIGGHDCGIEAFSAFNLADDTAEGLAANWNRRFAARQDRPA